MPRLVGQSHELAGKVFDLTDGKVSVGRTADNAIHIPDNSVSSHHAELILEGLDYSIKDLDSTNGTRLNGEKISLANLRRDDILRFGNVEFIYESEHEPISTPLPEISLGIALEGCVSRGRPPHFLAHHHPPKHKRKDSVPWPIFIGIALVIALAGVGYFIYSLLTLPGT